MTNILENKGAMVATVTVAASDSLNIGAVNYVADGVADDVEINAALAAGASGIVVLLEGTFNCTANLVVPADTKLEGQGFGTILNFDDGGAGTVTNAGAITINGDNAHVFNLKAILAAGCGAAGTRPNVIGASGRTLVWLQDLWLVGDTSVADDGSVDRQNGIHWDTVTHSKIINCRIEDNDKNSIHLMDASNYNTIEGNTCQGNTNYGVFIHQSDYNTIIGNICQGNTTGMLLIEFDNSTISGNTCQGNTYGIYLSTSNNNTLVRNTCQGNTQDGILLNISNNNTLTGNTCQGNTINGIYFYGSDNNNTITGNICADNGSNGVFIRESNENTITGNQCDGDGSGIYIDRSSYCIVTGNGCHNHAWHGIYIAGGAPNADYNTVTGNACHGNGSNGIEIFEVGAGDSNKNTVTFNELTGNTGASLVDGGTNTVIGSNVLV